MRTLVSRFATLVVALVVLAFPALGQKPMGGSVAGMLPLGSVTQAETYLATNTYWVSTWFWQKVNGKYQEVPVALEEYLPWITSHRDDLRPKNKGEVSVIFDRILNDSIALIAANNSIDKSVEFTFSVGSDITDQFGNSGIGFSSWGTFRFVITDGTLIKPMVTNTLELPDPIPVCVSGIRWARIETWPSGQTENATVWDYRLDPATDPVDPYSEVLLVPLMVLDQHFETKISIFVDSFELFDGKGIAIEETPFKTEIEKSDNTLVIKVLGGDSGRAFRLVSRASLASGQPVPFTTTLFVPPVYQPSVAAYVPASGSMRFYQVETLEIPPK